jgi:hypothetical protein
MQTAVLLILFNRPETTRQVFEVLREVKPRKLFVAADGPRPGKEGEAENCAAARAIVSEVDWDCELKTLFRDKNAGCGRGPSEAISWFFEQVEEGIILEDDCLPDPGFFRYASELLERYRNEERIFLVSGTNFFADQSKKSNSYFFSQYAGIWGWATWKRAWKHFNFSVPEWSDKLTREKVLGKLKKEERELFNYELTRILDGKLAAWDFQWWFYRLLNDAVGTVPNRNQVTNIGFGPDATHTMDPESQLANLPVESLSWPLEHPDNLTIDKKYERQYYNSFFRREKRAMRLLRKYISPRMPIL